MAGEAEISFEEAMGVAPASAPAEPLKPSKGEISFTEVAGAPIPKGPSLVSQLGTQVSGVLERQRRSSALTENVRGLAFDQLVGDVAPQEGDSFGAHAGKAALRGIRALVTSPTKAAVGGVKALTSGVVGLGESSAAGIRGLGRAAGEAIVKETVGRIPTSPAAANLQGMASAARQRDPLSGAVTEIEESMEETSAMREVASQITKVNLVPENEQEEAMEGLLMLMPEGIAAAGDTVFEKTGSALAGAGTQGVLTLLTFKPQLVTKVFSGKATPKIEAAVEKLAKEDLPAAEAVVEHVEQSAPQAGKKLRAKFNQATGKWEPTQLGEKAVKAEIKGKEITAEEAGVGLSDATADLPQQGKPAKSMADKPQLTVDEFSGQFEVKSATTEFLAQESGKYLQVKRADVVEAARGKGHAQEVMQLLAAEAETRGLTLASDFSVSKDAQRVYDALRKKGFEVKENPHTVNPETGSKVSVDPRVPVYEVTKTKVAEPVVAEPTLAAEAATPKAQEIFVSGPTLSSLPGGKFVEGKMKAWWDEIIHTINPEGLGAKAKQAAAVLANKIAETMNKDAANHGLAADRISFWEKVPPTEISEFIKRYEKGQPQKDPALQKLDKYLRDRADAIFKQDQSNGIKYDPIDNYLYHIFADGEKLARHFEAKYGKKWGNPGFMKNRTFDFYDEAVKAGFKPKFTNPEEIILARQHASDMAQMQVELLRDLEGYGLAREKTKAQPDPPKGGQYNYRRSPNGKGYWVESTADAILHNAFDTKSLWNMPGIRGDVFKGAMFLKNSTVPLVLSLSLFHPLHLLLGMDSAAAMTRLTKEMMVSGGNPVKWFGKWLEQMTLGSKGIPLWGIIDNPKVGFRLLKAYQGKVDPAKLTMADRTALQYMNEGGFIPEMSTQFRSNAMENFRKAVRSVAAEYNSGPGGLQRAAGAATKAGFYTPFAIIDAMQYPMFRLWIPALKIASYLKDVQTALKVDPTLATNKGQRLLTFRKLAKSVDNRYGEMAYNTLFWNRTVKDIAVANTLSLGWNLGFIREYGGGAMDIGQAAVKKGGLRQKVKQGQLDRPLFVMFYTSQVMLYSGLLTWALTGKPPTELIDYLYPKSGEDDSQGNPERLNTPFYPREFAAISKHVEHEGVGPGMWHVISNKSSGVIGLVKQWATGVDWRGAEVRDPNSSWHKQVRDTVGATLEDLEPISIGQLRQSDRSLKETVTAFSGFGKAPKYVTQTSTEASISQLYRKYHAPKQTAYEKALISDDRRKLAKFYDEGKAVEYDQLLDEMGTKYELTAKEQGDLARNIMKRGVDYNPYLTMFERLDWQQQKRLLDAMSPEEREIYLPRSNRQHLRFTYEEPSKESK